MSGARFRVTNPMAARLAAGPGVRGIAQAIAGQAGARSPHGDTGQMAAGWFTRPGRDPATTLVGNQVRHAVFVEYGTRHMRARPVLGPILAEWRARTGSRRRK
jgi:hypothetical protein